MILLCTKRVAIRTLDTLHTDLFEVSECRTEWENLDSQT